MTRFLTPLLIAALIVISVAWYLRASGPAETLTPLTAQVAADSELPSPAIASPIPDAGERAVYDLSVHTPEEMRAILNRLEDLATAPRRTGEQAGIALVLHGPEIDFFAIRNYGKYRDIVDLAAKLDAFREIEVKVCQTMMRELGLGSEDIPAFIEQIPYGPGEIERLRQEGYLYF